MCASCCAYTGVLTAADVILPSALIKYSCSSPLIVGRILPPYVRAYPYLHCFSQPLQWLWLVCVFILTPLGYDLM